MRSKTVNPPHACAQQFEKANRSPRAAVCWSSHSGLYNAIPSLAPVHALVISARMSRDRRSCSCRVVGTMQKAGRWHSSRRRPIQLDNLHARSVAGSWPAVEFLPHLHLARGLDAGLVEQLRQVRCSASRTRRRPIGGFFAHLHGRAYVRRPRICRFGVPSPSLGSFHSPMVPYTCVRACFRVITAQVFMTSGRCHG